jgi:hypothetical protein
MAARGAPVPPRRARRPDRIPTSHSIPPGHFGTRLAGHRYAGQGVLRPDLISTNRLASQRKASLDKSVVVKLYKSPVSHSPAPLISMYQTPPSRCTIRKIVRNAGCARRDIHRHRCRLWRLGTAFRVRGREWRPGSIATPSRVQLILGQYWPKESIPRIKNCR